MTVTSFIQRFVDPRSFTRFALLGAALAATLSKGLGAEAPADPLRTGFEGMSPIQAIFQRTMDEYSHVQFLYRPDSWPEKEAQFRELDVAMDAMFRNTGHLEMASRMRPMVMTFRMIDYTWFAPGPVFEKFAAQYGKVRNPNSNTPFFSGGRRLALGYRMRGYLPESEGVYLGEIKRCRADGLSGELAGALDGYGILLAAQGRTEAARQQFTESLAVRKKAGVADQDDAGGEQSGGKR